MARDLMEVRHFQQGSVDPNCLNTMSRLPDLAKKAQQIPQRGRFLGALAGGSAAPLPLIRKRLAYPLFAFLALLAVGMLFLLPGGSVLAQEAAIEYAEDGDGPVATYTAVDPEGKSIVWSLGGDDATDFKIANGVLSFAKSPNFESPTGGLGNDSNTYAVMVQAGDGGATPAILAVTVEVTNVDEPGTVTLSNLQPEAGVELTASITDPDNVTANSLTWQWESSSVGSTWTEIADATNAAYSPVDGDVGNMLRAIASYTDGEGEDKSAMAVSANPTIGARVSNTAPAFKNADDEVITSVNREVAENTPAGSPVGNPIAATDAENDILTYTLEGGDTASFGIDVATGQVLTKAPLNKETDASYDVTVRATDPSGGNDNSDTVDVAITVKDVDEDPSITVPQGGAAIDHLETADIQTPLATYQGNDPEGNTLDWSVSGADAGKFEIGTNGVLTFKAEPDFEAPGDANGDNVYEVTVEATDDGNNTATRDVTVKVTNVDEGGTVTLSGLQPRVGVPFTATLTDPDGDIADATWQWSRGNTDIEDATSATYLPVAADQGQTLNAEATYTDGHGEGKMADEDSANAVQADLGNKAPVFPDQDMDTDGAQTAQERTVPENTAAGVEIGDAVTATDPNTDVLQYALGGTDSASFSINRGTAQLSTKAELDFEDRPTYTVEVTATDSSNASATVTVTIKVTNFDESPALMGDDEAEYAENGTGPVKTYTASDPEGKAIVWSLAGDDAGDFTIGGGVLAFKSSPNFEMAADNGANNVYDVIVQAGDGGATPATMNVTVEVTNVEEPGRVTLSNLEPQAGVALTASIADPDLSISGTTWKWESSAGSSAWTEIEGATVMAYTPKDGDTGKLLRATASYTDGEGDEKSAMAVSANPAIGARVSNNAPAFMDAEDMDLPTDDREVAENTPAGSPVGDPVAATDDENNILTYTLGGTDVAKYAIDVETGQLLTKSPLDQEVDNIDTVVVTATDSSRESDTITVTIAITNVDEDPSVTTGATAIDHMEDETDLVLGTYVATDPEDQVSDLTWDVSGADSGKFEISATGELSFKAAQDFEAPGDVGGDNVYEVTVEVTDTGNNTATRNVTVKVTNADEDGKITLSGPQPRVDVLFTATLSDPDGGVSNVMWRWETVPNAAQCAGTVDAVTAEDALSTQATYTPKSADATDFLCVRVRYADAQGEDKDLAKASENTVQPDLGNKAPAFPDQDMETDGAQTAQERTVAEDAAAATDLGAAVTADDPNGDILQYTLGGPDASTFAIDAANGQLSTKAALDFEDKPTYEVMVTATDSSQASATVTVTIKVMNKDELPTITLGGLAISGDASITRAENDSATLATYTAKGPEAASASWSLSGVDASAFTIAGGVLAFASTPDFESPADADRDNVYELAVDADDGSNTAVPQAVTVTVTNVEEDGVVTLSADPQVGVELTASLADPDGDISGMAWQWARDDGAGDFEDIAGATSAAYTPGADDDGKQLRVTVTYTDGEGADKSAEAISAEVEPAAVTCGTAENRYDTNGNGIEKSEVLAAINDYLFGGVDCEITKSEVLDLINLYLFG